MSGSPIDAVGVLVPARDEAARIGPCVRSVLAALDDAPVPGRRALCVLADRCRDGTAAVARGTGRPAGVLVRILEDGSGGTVGALRNRAARVVLAQLGTDPARTWLVSTDADGTVRPDWLRHHLGLARAGADAVAGGVVLDRPGAPPPPGEPRPPDFPVYAANLGLRAGPFLAVGGFPERVAAGEDHGVVARLRAAGYRVDRGARATVRTSARRYGRASGGLADRIRLLETGRCPAEELPRP